MELTSDGLSTDKRQILGQIRVFFAQIPLLSWLLGALAAVALEYFIGTPFARTLGLRKAPMLFGFVIMLKKPALIHSALLYFVLIYLLPIGAIARLSAASMNRLAAKLLDFPLMISALIHLAVLYAILHWWSDMSLYRAEVLRYTLIAVLLTLSLNLIIPAMVLAPVLLVLVGAYPWIERYALGRDTGEHHLLDRPRNAPTRTALGVAMVTFYIVLMIGGGNDIIAYNFDLSFNTMIRVLQVLLFVGPVVAFIVTKRLCLSLQRRDRDLLLHGRETGRVLRLPSGEFLEIHEEVDEETRAKIMSKTDHEPLALPEAVDENGVAHPAGRRLKRKSRFSSFFYGQNIPLPSEEEINEAKSHIDHELHDAVEAGSQAAAEIAGQQPQ